MATTRRELARDLGWRLEALGWDIAAAILSLVPIDAASAFGGWALKLLGPLTPTHKTVTRNLRLAFPEWDEAKRRRLARDHWESIGRTFFEFFMVPRIIADGTRVERVNFEQVLAVALEGGPVIGISGHFANFEIMGATLLAMGLDGQLAYRPTNNPYVDARIRESRAAYGLKLSVTKGLEGGRELMATLAKGMSVAFLMDQKYREGPAVPFFGHLVNTQPAAVRWAMRFGVDLQTMSIRRLKGARYRVTIHEPIKIETSGCKAADLEAGLAKVNAFIEARVREAPEQWWWVHRRFPDALYAELAAKGH
jgi:KDO2-lipid IV(A) lauroyltransferase